MLIAALFTISQDMNTCPSMLVYFNEILFSHLKKKREVLPFATICIDLESTMLSQREEDKYYIISPICRIF